MKNIFYTYLCFAFLRFLNFLYSIISLFTSLLQHKISRSKPIARFSPGRVQQGDPKNIVFLISLLPGNFWHQSVQRNGLANCQLKILIFRSSGRYLKMSSIRGFYMPTLELTLNAFHKDKRLGDWNISVQVINLYCLL